MDYPTCSVIIPTRNRCQTLLGNLRCLVPAAQGLAEILVVDNASDDDTAGAVSEHFPSVRLIRLSENRLAAARNVGAEAARAPYLVMLDDDSVIDRSSLEAIAEAFQASPNLAALGCLVVRHKAQPDGEASLEIDIAAQECGPVFEPGGLPGVFIGCGAGIRREAWAEAGRYPEDFGYYVEEYDFCCRLWRQGRTVAWFDDIRVWHQRAEAGRDGNRMVQLLTRNNIRLWDRYAPPGRRAGMIEQTIERYGRIARKEGAVVGYEQGLAEGREAISASAGRREPLSEEQFRGLFGMNQARHIVSQSVRRMSLRRVAMYSRGKGAEQILECLREARVDVPVVVDESGAGQEWQGRLVVSPEDVGRGRPQAVVVGSLSPGAVRDLAREARGLFPHLPVIECVRLARVGAPVAVGAAR